MTRARLAAVLLAGAALVLAAGAAAGEGGAAPGVPASVRQGDVFVLRLPPGQPSAVSADFLGKTYPALAVAGEQGPVFLLGVDLAAEPGAAEIVVHRGGGGVERRRLTVVKRAFPEERLTLAPQMVTPPVELEERIAREQALAAAVYRTAAATGLRGARFTPPLAQKAAGNFGRRRILNGIAKSPHAGQDYRAPSGTPVKAIAGGTVRLARDFYYSGLTLFVEHGGGLVSVSMHLEKLLVAEGEQVAAGQTIGRVGSTGRATGPHLHLGVRLFEQRVDPELLWRLFPAQRAANVKGGT